VDVTDEESAALRFSVNPSVMIAPPISFPSESLVVAVVFRAVVDSIALVDVAVFGSY
jgi:hypothetical protein